MENWVHETAHYYRQVLHALSYPGDLGQYDGDSLRNPYPETLPASFLLPALTLLDRETCVYVPQMKGHRAKLFAHLVDLTDMSGSDLDQAEFILIPKDCTKEEITSCLEGAKVGDLLDPHNSATLLIDGFQFTGEPKITFKGPGIAGVKSVALEHPHLEIILTLRNRKVQEYPLGVDLVLLGDHGNMIFLPRTTAVSIMKGVDNGIYSG